MQDRAVSLWWKSQKPTVQNHFTTGYSPLLAIGKIMEHRNLSSHKFRDFHFGRLRLHIAWEPIYFEEGEKERLILLHRAREERRSASADHSSIG